MTGRATVRIGSVVAVRMASRHRLHAYEGEQDDEYKHTYGAI